MPGVDAEGKAGACQLLPRLFISSATRRRPSASANPLRLLRRQRLQWVTICIYLTVVGWSYSVVTLIALLQDKGFQNTLTTNRFAAACAINRQDFT